MVQGQPKDSRGPEVQDEVRRLGQRRIRSCSRNFCKYSMMMFTSTLKLIRLRYYGNIVRKYLCAICSENVEDSLRKINFIRLFLIYMNIHMT